MGAHRVEPKCLCSLGAHRVAPRWSWREWAPTGWCLAGLCFAFGPWSHLESRLNGYIFTWGTYTSINRLGATWVVPRWISRLGATWVVPR